LDAYGCIRAGCGGIASRPTTIALTVYLAIIRVAHPAIIRVAHPAIIRVAHPAITRGVPLPVVGRGANPADVGAVSAPPI